MFGVLFSSKQVYAHFHSMRWIQWIQQQILKRESNVLSLFVILSTGAPYLSQALTWAGGSYLSLVVPYLSWGPLPQAGGPLCQLGALPQLGRGPHLSQGPPTSAWGPYLRQQPLPQLGALHTSARGLSPCTPQPRGPAKVVSLTLWPVRL